MRTSRNFVGSALLACGAFASAAGASPAATPVFRIYDFENTQLQSSLMAYGGEYTDNNEMSNDSIYGNSMLTTSKISLDPDSTFWPSGRHDSSFVAMKLGFKLGTVRLGCGGECTYPQHVGVNLPFTNDELIDFGTATHLTFWAKAADSLVVIASVAMWDTVLNLPGYEQMFTIDTAWKKYSIRLEESADFKLPSWTPPRPFVVGRMKGLSFSINKDNNPDSTANALFVDDVEIVNWEYVDPAGVRPAGQARGSVGGLKARISGNLAYVRIPARFAGRTGVVEALDAAGRRVGRAAFGPQVSEVSLKLPANGAAGQGLYFRLQGD